MITLVYPSSRENYYLEWQGCLWGPMDRSGKLVGDELFVRCNLDRMEESSAQYHENNVDHVGRHGRVIYSPMIHDMIPQPTSIYPMQSGADVINCYNVKSRRGYLYGLLSTDCTSIVRNATATTAVMHYGISRGDNTKGVMYSFWILEGVVGFPTKASAYRQYDVLSIIPGNGDYSTLTYQLSLLTFPSGGSESGMDLTKPLAISSLAHMSFPALTRRYYATTSVSVPMYRPFSNTNDNPQTLMRTIELVARETLLDNFPIQFTHYGELAFDAAQKSRPNHVNMISFLKDLRHPTELIPKLRNLRNLKEWANNLLTVEYGILPTVSDVKDIVGAMKSIVPYVDRNGFDTYSASRFAYANGGTTTYALEQHLKLAIGSEDNALEGLVTSLENIGVFPSLENIWDLVPYSFVVDWLIGVGDFLERVDTRLRLTRFNIKYVTMSYKKIATSRLGSTSVPLAGEVSLVHYHRWVSDQCPVPPLSLHQNPDLVSHWLEASALIVQRAK